MASFHLSVKTVKRSAGRSATAAAAYRAGACIACEREGRVHDYTRKSGVEETFILAPEDAPDWAQDRSALWNAAEARETRINSVTAREWELALPSEIGAGERSAIVRDFAQELVARYGVAVDVAIHAPHREGDQRNHHAHVLTSTRVLTADGFTDKTRVLDAAKTGGVEIEAMRGLWAELQNRALERAEHGAGLAPGELERVDHRSLEVQREAAVGRGDALSAEALDRAPEVKLGPAANAIERREMRSAAAEGRDYEPVTERGAVVHAARQARALFAEMRARLDVARETYGVAREAGLDRVSAGLAALRAAAGKDRGVERGGEERGADGIRERLARIVGRDGVEREAGAVERAGSDAGRERLREALSKARDADSAGGVRDNGRTSIRERLEEVLGRARQALEHGDARRPERDDGIDRMRNRDRDEGHSL